LKLIYFYDFYIRLVSGAGEIKITKDGNVLLHEMQIQHPTASLIARTATAQDDITGDGTTSSVLIIAELLKQAEKYISEGLHPRIIVEGFDLAKNKALEILERVKIPLKAVDRETLIQVARSSLQTKVTSDLAEHLTPVSFLIKFSIPFLILLSLIVN
jgi:T-complex protein 1 subunit zeta